MSTKYDTTIELENGDEIEVEVDFDFQPAESMTQYYPGCDAQVDINYVENVENKEEVELTKEDEELMEERIMDWIDSYDDERWDY